MPKANGKQSTQQSNKASNDRFGVKREAENESFFLWKFAFRTPPFNATFRTQKKLLGIMRFSERLKIAISRRFCEKFRRYSETSRRL